MTAASLDPERHVHRRRRVPAPTVLGILLAVGIVGPLLALPASFIGQSDAFDQIGRTLLPTALRTSLIIGVGVGVGTLALGGGLALLVSFYDFPARRILDWALILPMAMPAYVLVYVVLGQYGSAMPLQSNLFGDGLRLSWLRTPFGAVVILTSVLYPYVYVLGRSAFLGQSRQGLEAARSLGLTYGQAIRRVALPLARPSLAAGAAVAVMEALADFGTVDLLGLQALTSAIYRVWFGAFDQAAALQLATVLVGIAVLMISLERLARGRARYHQLMGRGDAVAPRRLTGVAGLLAAVPGTALLVVVFGLPVAQLVAWSAETVSAGRTADDLWSAFGTTLLLAGLAAVVAVITATVVAYGQRSRPTPLGRVASRMATVGYAVPGTVVAVAVYVPLVWFDRRLIALGDLFGLDLGLVVTGSILGLLLAYLVRFHALAYFSIEAQLGRVSPSLDDAARALGADRSRVLADVHLPLLWPGIATGALLVLVEVMKELPATALLRPLGRDTLAILVWESTKDSRVDAAAMPALLIVLAGLIPVISLVRLLRRGGWSDASARL